MASASSFLHFIQSAQIVKKKKYFLRSQADKYATIMNRVHKKKQRRLPYAVYHDVRLDVPVI